MSKFPVDVRLTGSIEPYRAAMAAARRSTMPTPPLTPWRRTVRTVVQAVLALAVLAPFVIAELGLDPDRIPWVAGFLVVCAAITRIMAMPQVEAFLQRFLPWIAARDQRGRVSWVTVLVVAVVILLLLWAIGVIR